MPIISIVCGVILMIIGAIGYIDGLITGRASVTALIPALFGVVILLLGIFARRSEANRRHLMHAAVLIGLIGFLVPAGRIFSKMGEASFSAAIAAQLAMALVCLLFVVLAIRSFIYARRNDG